MNRISPITIRRAHPEEPGVLLLAALDSARVPKGPLLVAEVDGRVRAALSVDDDSSIADPFHPTGDLVDLLSTHAAATREQRQASLLSRLGLRPRSAF
jgi:hypothetical protein